MKVDHTAPAIQRGHKSAQALFPMHDCERCGKPGVHRHHKDENPLNNEETNVSILCVSCHYFEHGAERQRRRYQDGVRRGFATLYKGVCWHKRHRRWTVQMKIDGRNQTIFYTDDPDEAAIVYDAAVIAFRGEGYTNLIPFD